MRKSRKLFKLSFYEISQNAHYIESDISSEKNIVEMKPKSWDKCGLRPDQTVEILTFFVEYLDITIVLENGINPRVFFRKV